MTQNHIDVLPESQNERKELPFANVKLPSKGKLYPKTHPFHNCEAVDIREMTTEDENILFSEPLIKKGLVTNELIRACLVNKLVDPSTLLLGDKAAILLAIRVSAFTQEYHAQVTCGECAADFDHVFDLSLIEVKPLGAEPVEPFANLFEYRLPSGGVVHFSLTTDADDNELMQLEERRKKLGPNVKRSMVTDSLKITIKKLNGTTEPGEISKNVGKMKVRDSRALRAYIKTITPDMVMKQAVVCPTCEAEEVKTVPMGLGFFYPELGE